MSMHVLFLHTVLQQVRKMTRGRTREEGLGRNFFGAGVLGFA